MSRIWFVVWALVIGQIAFWTYAPKPQAPPQASQAHQPPRSPQATTVDASDGLGYGPNEQYTRDSRDGQRKGALAAFERPYATRCEIEGRKQFVSGIEEYYYHRQNQMERYPETFGKPGADYIAKQWSTGDDKRIERLTGEAYAQGQLKLSDFNDIARKMVQAVVRNERVTANTCSR